MSVLQLTENGIKGFVEGNQMEQFVLQVIEVTPTNDENQSYTVLLSDGYTFIESTFLEQASGEIQYNIIKKYSVIKILEYYNMQEGQPARVSGVQLVSNQASKLIGEPMAWADFREADYHNSKGSNNCTITPPGSTFEMGKPSHTNQQSVSYDQEQADNLLNFSKDNTPVELLENSHPILKYIGQFGFASIAGLTAAYFVEKIYKAVAFVGGGFFLALQFLNYKKLITIHWDNWMPSFSLGKLVKFLTFSSTGFGLGFYIGIKYNIGNASSKPAISN